MIIHVKGREPFELSDAFYINPAQWFGYTFLIESNWSNACTHQFIVEADNESDAIDELLDSKFGHLFKVSKEEIDELMIEYHKEFHKKKFNMHEFYQWLENNKDISAGGNYGEFYHSDMFLQGCINHCKVEGFNYKENEE